MREGDVVDQSNPAAFTDPEGRCAPFADSIECDDRRLLERAGEKGAGGMAFMMIGEDQTRLRWCSQSLADRPPHVQLVFEP